MVGGIQHPPALFGGEGALELQPPLFGEALQFREGVLRVEEGATGVDPLREGLQMGEHPVDRPVGEAALPVLVDLAPEIVDELPRDPRRPLRRSSVPISLLRKPMNNRKSRACSFRERSPVVTSVRK